jgi:hypothetical protein
MKRITLCVCLAVASLTVSASASAIAHQSVFQDLPLRLTSNGVNMSTVGTGQTASIDITIDRWSGDNEREQLLTAFLEKGPDQLLKSLQDRKSVGRISTPGSLGYDLRYARLSKFGDGGAKIVALTDRPISGWEAVNRPRVSDYPFTLIQIQLDSHGEGEGKLSVATKISYNKDERAIELETYASEPVRLQNVHIVR